MLFYLFELLCLRLLELSFFGLQSHDFGLVLYLFFLEMFTLLLEFVVFILDAFFYF
jgi:hypothetical protein